MDDRVLLFDLDGTLTDPREGITRCVQFALARQNIEVADRADLTCFIGPPLHDSFRQYYGLDDAQAGQAVADYRERFGKLGMYENAVYAGMPALLDALTKQGRRLFVATSKPRFYARPIVEHFGLARYFDHVYGSEMDGSRTDKRDLIAHILGAENLRPAEVIMIGDRGSDIAGAQYNGVAAIAVGYGYGSRTELDAAQPAFFCDSIAALGSLLLASSVARCHCHDRIE